MIINSKTEMQSIMRRCGFLPIEIDAFAKAHKAKHPDQPQDILKVANSAPFNEMLKSRAAFCKSMKIKGYGKLDIMQRVQRHYTKSGDPARSPWDFLKAEYQPTKKLESDAEWRAAVDAQKKIADLKVPAKRKPGTAPVRYQPIVRKVPEGKFDVA